MFKNLKLIFILLLAVGYILLIFQYVPYFYSSLGHISYFPNGYIEKSYLKYIDYQRWFVYFLLWTSLCYLLYYIFKYVIQNKK